MSRKTPTPGRTADGTARFFSTGGNRTLPSFTHFSDFRISAAGRIPATPGVPCLPAGRRARWSFFRRGRTGTGFACCPGPRDRRQPAPTGYGRIRAGRPGHSSGTGSRRAQIPPYGHAPNAAHCIRPFCGSPASASNGDRLPVPVGCHAGTRMLNWPEVSPQ